MDVGVHQDGLVHISQLSDKFVRNPADLVKVHQKVMVTVLDADLVRKRISLSMKIRERTKIKRKRIETARISFYRKEILLLSASTFY